MDQKEMACLIQREELVTLRKQNELYDAEISLAKIKVAREEVMLEIDRVGLAREKCLDFENLP